VKIVKRWEARFSVPIPDDFEGSESFKQKGRIDYLAIIEMDNDGTYYPHLHKVGDGFLYDDEIDSLWSTSLGSAKRRFNMDCDWKAGKWDWKEVKVNN
jgi:hypothetical protein